MDQALVHETLKGARQVMARRGLAKHLLVDRFERVCIRGAIFETLTGDPAKWGGILLEACEKAMGFTGHAYSHGVDDCTAPGWNNAPERTLEEVLARFQQGIDATRPEEPVEEPVEASEEPERILVHA